MRENAINQTIQECQLNTAGAPEEYESLNLCETAQLSVK